MSSIYTEESWRGLETVKQVYADNEADVKKLQIAFFKNHEDLIATCERLVNADREAVINTVGPILEKLKQPGNSFVKPVPGGVARGVESLVFDLYLGKVQKQGRIYTLTGPVRTWAPGCPYLYVLSWYDTRIQEIQDALRAMRGENEKVAVMMAGHRKAEWTLGKLPIDPAQSLAILPTTAQLASGGDPPPAGSSSAATQDQTVPTGPPLVTPNPELKLPIGTENLTSPLKNAMSSAISIPAFEGRPHTRSVSKFISSGAGGASCDVHEKFTSRGRKKRGASEDAVGSSPLSTKRIKYDSDTQDKLAASTHSSPKPAAPVTHLEGFELKSALQRAVKAGCFFYQIAGPAGLGKTMLSKLLIYELCGRLPAEQRPDLLYVRRQSHIGRKEMELNEALEIELAYCTDRPRAVTLNSPLHSIPEAFWNRRDASRPLYVIIDAFFPVQVIDMIEQQRPMWARNMKLCVYVGAAHELVAAQEMRSGTRDWPFSCAAPVPSMSEEDYLQCGYCCAAVVTQAFLCSVAGLPKVDTAASSSAAAPAPAATPPEAIPVLKYMYQLMGGSPLCLLRFAVPSALARFYRREAVLAGLQEAEKQLPLKGKCSAAVRHIRDAVHEMCLLRIGSYFPGGLTSLSAVGSLFFRQELVLYRGVGPFVLKDVYATPAMECVVRHLVRERAYGLNEKIEWFIGEQALATLLDQRKSQAVPNNPSALPPKASGRPAQPSKTRKSKAALSTKMGRGAPARASVLAKAQAANMPAAAYRIKTAYETGSCDHPGGSEDTEDSYSGRSYGEDCFRSDMPESGAAGLAGAMRMGDKSSCGDGGDDDDVGEGGFEQDTSAETLQRFWGFK